MKALSALVEGLIIGLVTLVSTVFQIVAAVVGGICTLVFVPVVLLAQLFRGGDK
jgi:hypothetical protein